jgi:hypothetical protein
MFPMVRLHHPVAIKRVPIGTKFDIRALKQQATSQIHTRLEAP